MHQPLQDDAVEKGRQVSIIGTSFRKAATVLDQLGLGADGSSLNRRDFVEAEHAKNWT